MATLKQLEAALVNANKAGDMDAVRKLAPIIKTERDSNAKFADIPGYNDFPAEVPGTTAAKPEPSLGQKVIGAGEAALSTATGATTGAVGMIGGFLKGLAQDVLSGKYGTEAGAKLVDQSAEAGANALTYQPRTDTGQQYASAVGDTVAQAAPIMPMTAELGVAGEAMSAAKPVVRTAARETVAPIQSAVQDLAQQVKAKISGAPEAPAVGASAVDQPQSVGAAAVDPATLRQAAADELPVPIKLTEGQKTRSFDQQRFERETAKLPDVGEPIRQRFQDQNLKLQQNMDAFIDDTGAELSDARGVGEVVDKALRARAGRDKTKIRSLYKEADKAGETSEPVDMSPVAQTLKDSESAKSTAPVIGATEQELNRLQATQVLNGDTSGKLSLGNAEQLRKFVNKVTGNDPTNVKFARDIKEAIDTATEDKGGEFYKQARAARAQYANDYENFGLAKQLLGTKRGSTDRSIAMEDVLHKSVISPSASVDTISKLRQLLESEGDNGKQAWKEVQGGMLRHVRDEALKGVTTDSAGNKVVSPAALDRTITQLDKTGKLDYVLGKKKAEQLRTINDVAKTVLTSPPGAVNTSNTASVLAGLLDVGISGMTGVPAPVATTVRLVTSRIKDARLRARVKQSLGE